MRKCAHKQKNVDPVGNDTPPLVAQADNMNNINMNHISMNNINMNHISMNNINMNNISMNSTNMNPISPNAEVRLPGAPPSYAPPSYNEVVEMMFTNPAGQTR